MVSRRVITENLAIEDSFAVGEYHYSIELNWGRWYLERFHRKTGWRFWPLEFVKSEFDLGDRVVALAGLNLSEYPDKVRHALEAAAEIDRVQDAGLPFWERVRSMFLLTGGKEG